MAARVLVDADHLKRTVARIAHEVVERHAGAERPLAIVGIHTNGVPLAARLAALIGEFTGDTPPLGSIDIALYRDDVGVGEGRRHAVPVVGETILDFDISHHTVLLVDDVLYTGRTIRAALDALIDFGRPKAIQLAVLIDRGHRELPIKADYVGKNVPTSRRESVQVRLEEVDGHDDVLIQTAGE